MLIISYIFVIRSNGAEGTYFGAFGAGIPLEHFCRAQAIYWIGFGALLARHCWRLKSVDVL
jgi:hypothetical protein